MIWPVLVAAEFSGSEIALPRDDHVLSSLIGSTQSVAEWFDWPDGISLVGSIPHCERSPDSFNCSTLCTGRSDYIGGMSALEKE